MIAYSIGFSASPFHGREIFSGCVFFCITSAKIVSAVKAMLNTMCCGQLKLRMTPPHPQGVRLNICARTSAVYSVKVPIRTPEAQRARRRVVSKKSNNAITHSSGGKVYVIVSLSQEGKGWLYISLLKTFKRKSLLKPV